ncbi:DNA repair protein RAD50 [Thrips palmi]|uniref:DNA repair protein RAD50 n=1 Tax=Thrips palmi TaxID=161013 RepID=A0A6P8YIU1_THRPL|nr:DNA repair protein RAD50 [Thrips palmi]
MATLNKLSLSGVRSFGPDGTDEQRIYFDKPFNLILGRNGCGKTTLIEALKYACSGTMPPGQGVNLVRDPKLDKQSETRAQIKLNFQSGRGENCTMTRSMSSKIKGGKSLEFKTVDTAIQIMKNGKPEQMTGRCVDMDDLMIKLLGVSKPILNYVIFCHQEDSHWPLDEGKKLKEKFDEIFDSTKYNKCMNEVRKLRKAALDDKKVSEVSLRHLECDVTTLKQKRGELLLLNERFANMEKDLEALHAQKSLFEEEYDVWHTKYKDYGKIKMERDDAKTQLTQLMYQQEAEKKHITHLFTGSEEDLQIEIRSFDDQLQQKKEAHTQIQEKIERLSDTESQKKTESLDIQKLICKLEADKEQEQKTKNDRNLKLSNLARSFELSGLPADATEEDVDDLHDQVKRKFQILVNSISARKLQLEKEQNDLQEEINKCLQTIAKIESEIQVKEDNVLSNDTEIQTLKDKLRSVNERLRKKQQIDKDLEVCRERRDKASKNEDSEALKIKIDELQHLCSSLEERQNELSSELVELFKYRDTQKSLQIQEEKHKDALTQIQRLRCQNEDSISKLLGNSTDGTLKQDFDSLEYKLKSDIDQLKKLKSDKTGEISTLDLNRNHKKSSLEKKQADLERKKESLFKLCGKKKLDEVLRAIETEMESHQNDKGLFNSTQIVLSGYVKQLKQRDPCCPLCHRRFSNDHESSDLVDELNGNMNNLPHRVAELNEKLAKLQQKQRDLLQLKPVEKDVIELESEIPSLQNDVLGLEGVIDATREELCDVEERLQSPEADLRTAQDIRMVIFDIDRYHKESKLCTRQIERFKQDLSHLGSTSRTSEQCAAEQQQISDELSATRTEKRDVEKRQREYLNILNDFDQQINKLVAQQLEIKEFVQQEDAMKERLTELSHVNDTIQSELKDLKQKLKPAFDKHRNAEEVLYTMKKTHKRELQEMENKKQEREMSIRLLSQTKETLNNLRRLKISETLESNKKAHQELVNEINQLETKRNDLAKQSEDLKETLGEHEKRKKELEGNMIVLRLSKQIKKQEKKLEMAERKLGDTDAHGIANKIHEIQAKISDVNCQVNELKGNKRGLEDNIKSRKEELQEDRYRNAERKYKEKLVKLTVLIHTEKDLQKYYNALDVAMQHFHRDRMASVNKLIRELWRLIYRGNDTDYIEIKTDESALGAASNASDKKRNYNYRVVQVKNGTEIDMRGRCSAGQKVLASLIIRLALAETFSANCGILALDEPTTNLDKDNIRSLCQAIVEIVHEREHTTSFQLICITHDHEFLDMMTEMDFFSHYWEVSRDHRSKSVIKKREVFKS